MINSPASNGTKEESIGWRIYGIWQETRSKALFQVSEGPKGYIWFLVEPLKAEFGIRPNLFPLGNLGLSPIVYSH